MIEGLPLEHDPRRKRRRDRVDRAFHAVCIIASSVSVLALATLLISIAAQGWSHLNLDFVRGAPSRHPEDAGFRPALIGSVWILVICALAALPLGIATAVFLEEYRPRAAMARRIHGFIEMNIRNLAGVPSIVYGILGLTVFVQMFGVFGNLNDPGFAVGVQWYDQVEDTAGNLLSRDVEGEEAPLTELVDGLVFRDAPGRRVEIDVRPAEEAWETEQKGVVPADAYVNRAYERAPWYLQLPFGRSVLAGGLTLALVILPIVIISSQEALRAVPSSLREGALATGATKWQVVRRITLPAAIPGVMTGSILAMSRAIGEAAPILVIGGILFILFTPENLMDDFTAMPLQIFNWAGRPQTEFHKVAASGIIVLLAILLAFNATAVFIRHKFQKPLS